MPKSAWTPKVWYGALVCLLIGGNTHGSGMPDSKGFDVTLKKLSL